MTRRILHVDMDSFFASVEAERRGLEGEPLVICVYSGRSLDSGAVSTCSYEARELGISAGISITRAKSLAEDAEADVHFIPMDREYYQQVSDSIREDVFEEHADRIEQASIDEAYIDVTDRTASFDDAVSIAGTIREEVEKQFDLTCSVGVGPNRLVAKIASDRDKPDGRTVVHPDEVEEFMRSLELADVHGIGDRTVEKLGELGITSVEGLAGADTAMLVREFGETLGVKLREKAHGVDETPVEESAPTQLSRLTTLDQDSRSLSHIRPYLEQLTDELFDRVREEDVAFRTVSLLVVDTGISMHTRSGSLETPVQDRDVIEERVVELLEEFLDSFDGEIRRVGVRVSNLEERAGQKSLSEF